MTLKRQIMSINTRLSATKLIPVVLLVAFGFAAMYLLTAWPRLVYPYDLDFIEDGILMTSLRLSQGQPIFIAPQADFAPHVYMPLYAWLGGLLFKLTAPGYGPLRGLSLLATLTTVGLIFWIARRESSHNWLGLACAGLYLGGYRINGFWYELARVDSLFVALSLAGLALGVYGRRSKLGLVGAAMVLALAFLTKQTALVVGIGLGMYLLITIGRWAWLYWLPYGLLTITPVILLNWLSDGRFLYYTYHIASINPVELGRVLNFVGFELLGVMAGLTLMTILAALLTCRQNGLAGLWRQPWFIWIGLAVVISGLGRASVGGNLNNRMIAYSLLCLGPALLMDSLIGYTKTRAGRRIAIVSLLILSQFALGGYNPLRYIPTPAMSASGNRLIERIAAEEGEVLVLLHPYYAWLAGKQPSAQIAALWHARERGTLPLPADFVARIESRYYAAIIADNSLFETEPELQQLLNLHYIPAETLAPDESPPTLTGMVVRPEIVYRPRQGELFNLCQHLGEDLDNSGHLTAQRQTIQIGSRHQSLQRGLVVDQARGFVPINGVGDQPRPNLSR